MTISRMETDQASTVILSGAADLRDGAALRAALIECLDIRRPTTIDLSGLERADVGFLQLICSAVRTFKAAGVSLTARDPAGDGESAFRHAVLAGGFLDFDLEAAS